MALINHSDKWIWLMEPHTASRAVHKMLMDHCGGVNIGHHHISVPELVNWRRVHVPAKTVADMDVYATVRNPFDVLVTRWKFGEGKDQPFHKWAWDNREHYIVAKPLRGLYQDATSVVYYEDLEEDLRWVFGKGTTEDIHEAFRLPYNQGHKTAGKTGWGAYYKEDNFRLFDYLMEREYGQFCTEYGYDIDRDDDGPWCSIEEDWCREIRRERTKQIRKIRGTGG